MTGRPGHPETLDSVDIFAPETVENWYPTYELLQREAPVYHVPGTRSYFVTRYDEICTVLRRTDLFERGTGEARPLLKDKAAADYYAENGWPKVLPLAVNPPVHRCYRDLVDHFFSVAGAEKQRGLITRVANELLDTWIDDGEVEYVEQYASPLPAIVITEMMGFPRADLPQLKEWSAAWVAPFSGQLDAEQEREVARLSVDFQHYIADHIAHRRAHPGAEDVVSHLVNTEVHLPSETRPLTDGEIINIVDHLYIGGNETTTFALTSGLWLLVQQPEMQARLRSHPHDARRFVDEVLRLESPTQGMDRSNAEDTVLGGVEIPKGSHIHIRYAAANRDDTQFGCPADVDIDRSNGHRHLAFSLGESHCPGAGLSRLEQTITTQLLMERLDDLAFAEGKNSFQHHMNLTLRSFTDLHVTFRKR